MNAEGSQHGMISVFWGNGKGKTTAALGMALRALGHGLRVHIIQFMKTGPEGSAGELEIFDSLEGISVERFGAEEWIIGEITPQQDASIQAAVEAARSAVSSGNFDLVILDEILYAVSFGALSGLLVVEVLWEKDAHTNVVLTGGWTESPEVVRVADLVTEMRKVKHPFDLGIPARKGIEF